MTKKVSNAKNCQFCSKKHTTTEIKNACYAKKKKIAYHEEKQPKPKPQPQHMKQQIQQNIEMQPDYQIDYTQFNKTLEQDAKQQQKKKKWMRHSIRNNDYLYYKNKMIEKYKQQQYIFQVRRDTYSDGVDCYSDNMFIKNFLEFKRKKYLKMQRCQPNDDETSINKYILQTIYGYSQQLIKQLLILFNQKKQRKLNLSLKQLPLPDLMRETRNSVPKQINKHNIKHIYYLNTKKSDCERVKSNAKFIQRSEIMKIELQIYNGIKYSKLPFFKTTLPKKFIYQKRKNCAFIPSKNIYQRRLQFLLYFWPLSNLLFTQQARILINMDDWQVDLIKKHRNTFLKQIRMQAHIQKTNNSLLSNWIHNFFFKFNYDEIGIQPKYAMQLFSFKRQHTKCTNYSQYQNQLGYKVSKQLQMTQQSTTKLQASNKQIQKMSSIFEWIYGIEKQYPFQFIYDDFDKMDIDVQINNWEILEMQKDKTMKKCTFAYNKLISHENKKRGYHVMDGLSEEQYDWQSPNLTRLKGVSAIKRAYYESMIAKFEQKPNTIIKMIIQQNINSTHMFDTNESLQDLVYTQKQDKQNKIKRFEGSFEWKQMIKQQSKQRRQFNERCGEQILQSISTHESNNFQLIKQSEKTIHYDIQSEIKKPTPCIENDKYIKEYEKHLIDKIQMQMRNKPICADYLKEHPNASYSQLIHVYESSNKPTQKQLEVIISRRQKLDKYHIQNQWQEYNKFYPNLITRDQWIRQRAKNYDTPIQKLLDFQQIDFESILQTY